MTSVMQGFLFNLKNYFFRTVPQEVCFSQKPDSIMLHHSKFLFFLPPRNSRQLSYSCSGLWSYCHQLQTVSFLPALLLSRFPPFFQLQWKFESQSHRIQQSPVESRQSNPRGCLEDALLTAHYIPDTCWTPLWNCGYRESSSMKENKHSVKKQDYLAKNAFILTS